MNRHYQESVRIRLQDQKIEQLKIDIAALSESAQTETEEYDDTELKRSIAEIKKDAISRASIAERLQNIEIRLARLESKRVDITEEIEQIVTKAFVNNLYRG